MRRRSASVWSHLKRSLGSVRDDTLTPYAALGVFIPKRSAPPAAQRLQDGPSNTALLDATFYVYQVKLLPNYSFIYEYPLFVQRSPYKLCPVNGEPLNILQ